MKFINVAINLNLKYLREREKKMNCVNVFLDERLEMFVRSWQDIKKMLKLIMKNKSNKTLK